MTQQYQDVNGRKGFLSLQGESGKTYGDTRLFDLEEITTMLADGIVEWVHVPPTPAPPSLAIVKSRRKQQMTHAYDYVVRQPVTVSVQGQDKEFPMEDTDREWMNSMNTALGAGWSPGMGFYRKDMAGARVNMNMADIREMGKKAFELVEANTVVLDDLLDSINAATDAAAVDAIVWPWPGGVDPRAAE